MVFEYDRFVSLLIDRGTSPQGISHSVERVLEFRVLGEVARILWWLLIVINAKVNAKSDSDGYNGGYYETRGDELGTVRLLYTYTGQIKLDTQDTHKQGDINDSPGSVSAVSEACLGPQAQAGLNLCLANRVCYIEDALAEEVNSAFFLSWLRKGTCRKFGACIHNRWSSVRAGGDAGRGGGYLSDRR